MGTPVFHCPYVPDADDGTGVTHARVCHQYKAPVLYLEERPASDTRQTRHGATGAERGSVFYGAQAMEVVYNPGKETGGPAFPARLAPLGAWPGLLGKDACDETTGIDKDTAYAP